jgi:hypothetical protein
LLRITPCRFPSRDARMGVALVRRVSMGMHHIRRKVVPGHKSLTVELVRMSWTVAMDHRTPSMVLARIAEAVTVAVRQQMFAKADNSPSKQRN